MLKAVLNLWYDHIKSILYLPGAERFVKVRHLG